MTKTLIKIITALFLITALIVFVVLSSDRQSAFTYSSYDICHHQQLMQIAKKHRAAYVTDDSFDMPATRVLAKAHLLKSIQDEFNAAIQDSSSSSTAHCHLIDIKHHAKHINPKLSAFIPSDVDYVSYAPPDMNQDKAVYCYYYFDELKFNRPKSVSQCYFIHLKDDILIKDDISDLERLNLQNMPHQQSFFKPFSTVDAWHDKTHLRYGIRFYTKANNQRYGYADDY